MMESVPRGLRAKDFAACDIQGWFDVRPCASPGALRNANSLRESKGACLRPGDTGPALACRSFQV